MIRSFSKRRRLRVIIPSFPTFNIYTRIARRTTALGPLCVATSAREVPGWDVELIDENNLRRYPPLTESGEADHQLMQRERPADAVALYGGLTSSIPRLYEIARFYREQGVPTIAGGQHFAEENLNEGLDSNLDYIVIGEGEATIQELLELISGERTRNQIRGIAYLADGKLVKTEPRPVITDFSQWPLPDFSLVRYARISLYPVERIRGCGMDCEFCTVKGKPRPATPERLFENIRYLVESMEARDFFLVDDLFGQQRDETIRFCQLMIKYQQRIRKKLSLTVQIRWDKGKDSELLLNMRQAGVSMVAIGFESPIREELEAMKKRVNPEEMLQTTREFRKFGFWVHGMFIFGYPIKSGTDFQMSMENRIKAYRQFIRKAKIDTIQVLLAGPLPGTELRERLRDQNRIYPLSKIGWQYYDGNFPLFEPDPPNTSEEIQFGARKIMRQFYGFRHFFLVGLKIFSFPSLFFFLYNIKRGWRRWKRSWRNYLVRVGGWLTIKDWLSKDKKDPFRDKLQEARQELLAKGKNRQTDAPPSVRRQEAKRQ